MSKRTIPSRKDKQIANAKIAGHSNKDIGAIQYPNANPLSQRQQVSKVLKKQDVAQYVEQGKLIALKKHNITWDRIIRPVSDALDAEKQNQFTGEINPDHGIRLSAVKLARELIEKTSNEEVKEHLMNLSTESSDIEIVERVFKASRS